MSGALSLPHLLIIGIAVLVLLGTGKVSSMMGEVGKGLSAFRKGMDEGRREIAEVALVLAPPMSPPEMAVQDTGVERPGGPA